MREQQYGVSGGRGRACRIENADHVGNGHSAIRKLLLNGLIGVLLHLGDKKVFCLFVRRAAQEGGRRNRTALSAGQKPPPHRIRAVWRVCASGGRYRTQRIGVERGIVRPDEEATCAVSVGLRRHWRRCLDSRTAAANRPGSKCPPVSQSRAALSRRLPVRPSGITSRACSVSRGALLGCRHKSVFPFCDGLMFT